MSKPQFFLDPTSEQYKKEKQFYARQWSQFSYQAPDRYAPAKSRDYTGWGIHTSLLAPKEAVGFVLKLFRSTIANPHGEEYRWPLRPQIEYWVMASTAAHFLWFLEREGAPWVLGVFGVIEVPPFVEAYTYLYRNPSSTTDVVLNGEKGCLRILETTKPRYDPPVRQEHKRLENGGPVHQQHIEIMRRLRHPMASRETLHFPTPAYSHYISGFIADWFTQSPTTKTHADHWDAVKRRRKDPNRKSSSPLNGYDWAFTLLRGRDKPFFPALHHLHKYQPKKKRIYRLQGINKGVAWCNPPDLRNPLSMTQQEKDASLRAPVVFDMPKMEYLRRFQGITEEQGNRIFTCTTCNNRRTCVPSTGRDQMCCHCYGTVVESDVRGTLDWCTSWECRGCPDHISSEGALVELKNTLNRSPSYPIHRQSA